MFFIMLAIFCMVISIFNWDDRIAWTLHAMFWVLVAIYIEISERKK